MPGGAIRAPGARYGSEFDEVLEMARSLANVNYKGYYKNL
jgi:hypothetical protein